MPIQDIVFVKGIYPRLRKNDKTVEAYAEALQAGAEFPPIVVQKVLKEVKGEQQEITILMDGSHRLEAHKQNEKEEITVEHWKEETINYEENIDELKLEAAKYNIKHGDRLTSDDKKENARSIIKKDINKNWTNEKLGEYLGVPTSTIRDWTKDIRSRQAAEEESLINKLKMLGWTHSEIVDNTRLEDQSSISRITSKFDEVKTAVKEQYENKEDLDEICFHNKIEEAVAWAILLEEDTNNEKFEKLKTSESGSWKKEEDVWIFKKPDDRFGIDDANRTPGQIMVNLLHYFTNKKDRVVDLFAGGGTLVDACLIFERRCYGYDPNPSRNDIMEKDCTKTFPGANVKKADLVYFEFSLAEGESKNDHLAKVKQLIDKCYDKMKDKAKFAFMAKNHVTEEESIWVKEYWDLFEDAGFKTLREIQCPRSADDEKVDRMAPATRSLLVFIK